MGQAALGVYGIVLDRPASAFLRTDGGRITFDPTKNSRGAALAEEIRTGTDERGMGSEWNLKKMEGMAPPSKDFIPGEEQFSNLSGQIVHVNISHEKDYAIAACLAPVEPGPRDVGREAGAREPYFDTLERENNFVPLA